MEWFYAKQGQQQGPCDLETLREKFQNGEISETDLVWKEGMAEWVAAGTLTELSAPAPEELSSGSSVSSPTSPSVGGGLPGLSPSDAPTPPTGEEKAVTGAQAMEQPKAGMAHAVPKSTPGLAIASMVCGIIAVFASCCYGLGVFVGLAAIICGHMQMKRYKEEPDNEMGKGMVISGLVMGYLSILLSLLMIGYIVFAIITGINSTTSLAPPTAP